MDAPTRAAAMRDAFRDGVIATRSVGGQARRKPAGQARSRPGALTLAAERKRRVADAVAQPRTPVTRDRFWFKTVHRRPPVRRRALDEAARQEYAERDYELEQSIGGLKVAIGHIRDEIARDVYNRGKRVDYRHAAKGSKAFNPYGRRISHAPEVRFDSAEREARARIRELNDEARAVREERKSIADVMKHGETSRSLSQAA